MKLDKKQDRKTFLYCIVICCIGLLVALILSNPLSIAKAQYQSDEALSYPSNLESRENTRDITLENYQEQELPNVYYADIADTEEKQIYNAYMDAAFNGQSIGTQDNFIVFGPLDQRHYINLLTTTYHFDYDFPLYSSYPGNNTIYVGIEGNPPSYVIGTHRPYLSYFEPELISKNYQDIIDIGNTFYNSIIAGYDGTVKDYVLRAYTILANNATYSDDIDDTIHNNDIYGALVEHESKCAGMSLAMKYMLDKAGIKSYVVYGNVSSGQLHAWNAIWIDNQWYMCDLTLGQNYIKQVESQYVDFDNIIFTTYCFVPEDSFYEKTGYTPSEASEKVSINYKNMIEKLQKEREKEEN